MSAAWHVLCSVGELRTGMTVGSVLRLMGRATERKGDRLSWYRRNSRCRVVVPLELRIANGRVAEITHGPPGCMGYRLGRRRRPGSPD